MRHESVAIAVWEGMLQWTFSMSTFYFGFEGQRVLFDKKMEFVWRAVTCVLCICIGIFVYIRYMCDFVYVVVERFNGRVGRMA